jgi:hypothetical protein
MAKKKDIPRKITPQKSPLPQQIEILSGEQQMLRELFGNRRLWGSGKNLPRRTNTITSGGGLINNGDFDRETARLFGLEK